MSHPTSAMAHVAAALAYLKASHYGDLETIADHASDARAFLENAMDVLLPPGIVADVARELFPDAYHDGTNCKAEVGRPGTQCRVCEARSQEWKIVQTNVRNALLHAGLHR